MKKSSLRRGTPLISVPAPAPLLSRRGKKVIGSGIGLLIAGFFILTRTDPSGQNWASTVSPLLLVCGYALIGVGIILKDPFQAIPTSKPVR